MVVAIHILIGYLLFGIMITAIYAIHYSDVKQEFNRYDQSVNSDPRNEYYQRRYQESAKKLRDTWFRLITMFVAWLPYACQYVLYALQQELNTVNKAASACKDEDNG